MNNRSYFLEKREIAHIVVQGGQLKEGRLEYDQGVGSTCLQGENVSYHWRAFAPGTMRIGGLPAEVRSRASTWFSRQYLSSDVLDEYADFVPLLTNFVRDHDADGLDISLREMHQRILHADSLRCVTDYRHFVRLRLQVFVRRDNEVQSALRTYDFPSRRHLLDDRAGLEEKIGKMVAIAREKCMRVACPKGKRTILLAPGGSPAQFFHEVCGHALEGDIVSHQASYCNPLLGQRVAEDFVTVLDDPAHPHASASYRVDDEGIPAQTVALISRGIVCEPLLDTYHARLLQRSSNGHGRRLNFRYSALPRLNHVVLQPQRGKLEELAESVSQGALVLDMSLRHLNTMTGNFSFYIREAREIRNGEIGAFLAPGILQGNALEALRAIDAVGADVQPGGSGCGKLDQGPLYLSFSQPSLRFKYLWIEPGT